MQGPALIVSTAFLTAYSYEQVRYSYQLVTVPIPKRQEATGDHHWCLAYYFKDKILNKAQFIDHIADRMDSSKSTAKKWLEAFVSGIYLNIHQQEGIKLSGLGKFIQVSRKARIGRNPRTGEEIRIPAKLVPKFKPAKRLKELVQKKKPKATKISLSIGAKGGLCVSGINKFPVTLYKDQWKKLLKNSNKILKFINEYEKTRASDSNTVKKKEELKIKKAPKGGFSVYGMGRFPITLKDEQWRVLLSKKRTILKFIEVNNRKLRPKARQAS